MNPFSSAKIVADATEEADIYGVAYGMLIKFILAFVVVSILYMVADRKMVKEDHKKEE